MRFAALAGVVMALAGPAGAKVVYRTVDASGFDVGGVRLGMSAAEVAAVFRDRYGVASDEVSCQVSQEAGERQAGFVRGQMRLSVRFYHPVGASPGAADGSCAVYDVLYQDTSVDPERDFASFHDRLVARFGEATLYTAQPGEGMNRYFWCAKIRPGRPECAAGVATVSAAIAASSDAETPDDRFTASVELSDGRRGERK